MSHTPSESGRRSQVRPRISTHSPTDQSKFTGVLWVPFSDVSVFGLSGPRQTWGGIMVPLESYNVRLRYGNCLVIHFPGLHVYMLGEFLPVVNMHRLWNQPPTPSVRDSILPPHDQTVFWHFVFVLCKTPGLPSVYVDGGGGTVVSRSFVGVPLVEFYTPSLFDEDLTLPHDRHIRQDGSSCSNSFLRFDLNANKIRFKRFKQESEGLWLILTKDV